MSISYIQNTDNPNNYTHYINEWNVNHVVSYLKDNIDILNTEHIKIIKDIMVTGEVLLHLNKQNFVNIGLPLGVSTLINIK